MEKLNEYAKRDIAFIIGCEFAGFHAAIFVQWVFYRWARYKNIPDQHGRFTLNFSFVVFWSFFAALLGIFIVDPSSTGTLAAIAFLCGMRVFAGIPHESWT